MFCQRCMEKKQDDAVFCDQCGTRLSKEDDSNKLQWNSYRLFRTDENIYSTSYPYPKKSAREVLNLLVSNKEYKHDIPIFLVSFYPGRCKAVPGQNNTLHQQQVESIARLTWNSTLGNYIVGTLLPIKEILVGMSG